MNEEGNYSFRVCEMIQEFIKAMNQVMVVLERRDLGLELELMGARLVREIPKRADTLSDRVR